MDFTNFWLPCDINVKVSLTNASSTNKRKQPNQVGTVGIYSLVSTGRASRLEECGALQRGTSTSKHRGESRIRINQQSQNNRWAHTEEQQKNILHSTYARRLISFHMAKIRAKQHKTGVAYCHALPCPTAWKRLRGIKSEMINVWLIASDHCQAQKQCQSTKVNTHSLHSSMHHITGRIFACRVGHATECSFRRLQLT